MPTYLDKINRREVSIQRFASHLVKEYGFSNLDAAYRAARLILLDAEEITSRTKLNKILTEINKTVAPLTAQSNADITNELDKFGAIEAAFAANTLREFSEEKIKTPAKKKTQEYIQRSIMSLESGTSSIAGVWSEFVDANTDKVTRTIQGQITAGYANGDTTAEIIKRVQTATSGLLKNDIERLVRTGTAHYAQQANNYMRDDNLDVLARELPITTWDSRRSLICTSIEAKYGVNGSISHGWQVGKSPIGYPAYHYGCRTIVRALPKDMTLDGERPAIKGRKGEAAKEAFEAKEEKATVPKYTGRKDEAFKAELIPVKTQLSRFIRDSPIWYQEQLLGVKRARAFRRGELDLSELTDKRLSPLTVEELEIS